MEFKITHNKLEGPRTASVNKRKQEGRLSAERFALRSALCLGNFRNST